MTDQFQNWFRWLIKWEGSVYENDPDDPGGATKYGIDQRSHPKVNIRELTIDQAAQIYWDDYWLKARCDALPEKVAEIVGNIAVNTGLGRASRWLQEAVGAVQDGDVGPKTLALVNAANPLMLADKLLSRTETHYRSIAKGKLAKFLGGWLNRNNDLRKVLGIPHSER